MLCPYCAEEIQDKATVCKHCHSNLLAVRPFIDRTALLEQRVEDLAREVELRLVKLEGAFNSQSDLAVAGDGARRSFVAKILSGQTEPKSWTELVMGHMFLFISPFLLLLFCHWVIIVLYDLSPWFLRIAAMVVPMPFGVISLLQGNQRILFSLLFAFCLAFATVLGMSAITGAVDGSPVMPRDLREVKEMFEFAASISFSFLTGLLIGRWIQSYRSHEIPANATSLSLARLISGRQADNSAKLADRIKRANEIASAIMALTSTLATVVTGIHSMAGR